MDTIDRDILNMLQHEFPLDVEPFSLLAERLSVEEDLVLERIRALKERGVIRRIGGVFDTAKLGFVSTLCAARVPERQLERFVAIVNAYKGVTHHYLRDHGYNIWFTFIGSTGEEIQKAISCISEETGITDIVSMPVKRRFKVDARFGV